MTVRSIVILASLVALIATSVGTRQNQPSLPPEAAPAIMSGEGTGQMGGQMPAGAGMIGDGGIMQGQASADMQHMAQAMTSMAKTCEMMMHMEMANVPLKVTALAVFGLLTGTALVLLIVLEIQWIRLAGARIRSTQRQPPTTE